MTMFDNAKTVKTGAAPKGKKAKAEITIAGIEQVAALDAVIKTLTAIKTTKSEEVKAEMVAYFVETGAALKAQPENFRGLEGQASASCELRRRASTSPLTDEEAELLFAKGIPTDVIEEQVDTFVINPAHVNDPKIMKAIEAALKNVKGLPEDLFLKQDGRSKTIVGEKALEVLFASGDEDTIAELLPTVAVPAIKPKMESDDIAKAFAVVQKMVVPAKAK